MCAVHWISCVFMSELEYITWLVCNMIAYTYASDRELYLNRRIFRSKFYMEMENI